jgi:hypothetical protein
VTHVEPNTYYKTDAFRKDQSKNYLGMVYICTDLSMRNKYSPDSEILLEKFRGLSKISKDKSQLLKEDARRWWALKPKNIDYKFFWDKQCLTPENNMKEFFSKN